MNPTLIDLSPVDDLAFAHAALREKSYRADPSMIRRKMWNWQRWNTFMLGYGPQIDDILGMPVGWTHQSATTESEKFDFAAVERWARLAAVAVEVAQARERARMVGSHTKSAAKT